MYIKCVFVLIVKLALAELEGHMKPLGEQRSSEGHIEILNEVPSAKEFFNVYIKGSKPVVLKGFANNIPAFKLWTDDYLMDKFGDLKVDVEEGKKENRSLGMWQWSFKKFLKKYQESDVYMVYSLPKEMRGDLRLFPFLTCGGYTNVLNDVIMWFSSGGTKSVLHTDQVDNVNCLFSGTKQLYMVDYKHREYVTLDAPEGGFSRVDVDAVDLDKYPGLQNAPWWRADMEAGDCIFIPSRWFHQVRSFATNARNMAVNIWFYNMKKINLTDCQNEKKEFLPLNQFKFLRDANILLKAVRFLLALEVQEHPLTYKEMAYALVDHQGGKVRKGYSIQVIRILDKDLDGQISLKDIEALKYDDVKVISDMFPGLESEWEEDHEEGNEKEEEEIDDHDEVNRKTEL